MIGKQFYLTKKLYMCQFDEFLVKQKKAIVAEFVNNMSTCLASTTFQRLTQHAREYNWTLSELPGLDPRSVLVLKKSNNAFPELWVRWTYKNYRHAFGIYLRELHGHENIDIPKQLQVDHLQPTHRFKEVDCHYFIRLFLLEQKINATYGAGFEKSFNKAEREVRPIGGIHMDWMAFLKAYGVLPPSKRSSPEIWRRWAWETAAMLAHEKIESHKLAYDGILAVLQLGFTGYYAGSKESSPYQSLFVGSTTDTATELKEYPTRTSKDHFQYELKTMPNEERIVVFSHFHNGEKFPLPARRDLFGNYRGTFAWGYSGSGPIFLTISMLAHHLGHENFGSLEIDRLLQRCISNLPFNPFMSPYILNTELIQKYIGE